MTSYLFNAVLVIHPEERCPKCHRPCERSYELGPVTDVPLGTHTRFEQEAAEEGSTVLHVRWTLANGIHADTAANKYIPMGSKEDVLWGLVRDRVALSMLARIFDSPGLVAMVKSLAQESGVSTGREND
jgi:hypothetical protein